jgi:formate dehydrogenase subunit gamma
MQALAPSQRESILRIVAALKSRPGPLLEVLHGVQDELGFIPPAAVALIAEQLNLSRAEVHGVVTFYHHFRKHPAAQHSVQVCRAESCQSMGAEALADYAKRKLGVGFEQTTPDGKFSLDAVYCLGLCSCSPAMMIDGDVHGRVTPKMFDQLIAERAQK